MVSNSDDSRSGDRENLHLENAIDLQCFSNDLTYIAESLQTLRELQQLLSTCFSFLFEDGLDRNLSGRHVSLLFDMYVSYSELFCDEIEGRVTRLQRTVEKNI